MAHSEDESDTRTLPDPELNPLLNPVLAANMGRWAEVYFTSPPEKRGEAISQLVRELERDPQPASFMPGPDPSDNQRPREFREEPAAATAPDSLVAIEIPALKCGSCGVENSAAQRFCGMCGGLLMVSSERTSSLAAHAAQRTGRGFDEYESSPENVSHESGPESEFSSARRPYFSKPDSAYALPEEGFLGLGSRPDSESDFRSEISASPNRYRLYAGVGVAILLAALAYGKWHSGAAFRGAATAPSAVQPAAPAAQPGEPAAAPPTPQEDALPASQAHDLQAQAAAPPATTSRSVLQTVRADANPSAAAASGAEELAVAEKYLTARPDAVRDSREAATWLWKAVGKNNVTATMLLSDLYLRGDGVPKSCDQARLLLDAAARKGAPNAAERIRNLPALGCE